MPPSFVCFLLLCLFSYGTVTAKADNKNKEQITQSSLLSSVSNSTSITAMALPLKATSIVREVSQKSEANTTASLFLKGSFYGAISIILLLNIVKLLFIRRENLWILWIGSDRNSTTIFWRRQPLKYIVSRQLI